MTQVINLIGKVELTCFIFFLILSFNIRLIEDWGLYFGLIYFLYGYLGLMIRVMDLTSYVKLTWINLICCHLIIVF
jgi:hypothetical protein